MSIKLDKSGFVGSFFTVRRTVKYRLAQPPYCCITKQFTEWNLVKSSSVDSQIKLFQSTDISGTDSVFSVMILLWPNIQPTVITCALLLPVVGLLCIVLLSCVCIFVTSCVLFYYVCITVLRTLVAGFLARSQYLEGPVTGHLGTGFSWFPCVYKQMLRWFPRLQVATTCFSCSTPDLNFLDPYFTFMLSLFYIYVHA